MNLTKLRRLIREEIETVLDDEEFGPTNRPDQNVKDFEGFRGYIADKLNGCGAHPSIIDAVRTCDVGHPTHDVLWNTWGMVEPECSVGGTGVCPAEFGSTLWPYADGMARELGAIATEVGPDVIDGDDLSGRFCDSLMGECEPATPVAPGGMATFDQLVSFDDGVVVEPSFTDDVSGENDEFDDGSFGDEADVDALLDGDDDVFDERDDNNVDEAGVILDPLGYDASELEDDDEDDDEEEDVDEAFEPQTHCEICGEPLDHGICNDCE